LVRELQEWWYSRHPRSMEPDNIEPNLEALIDH
jgi:hypothetical protein